ncbi:hypothetical protein RHSIM_Rhsim08G0178600 [Rhododendron simsii]|uniref:DUF4283 domain-containing protein n=1 Tax=Rhododendron simsii TaxID=118357 RepID=A0A834GGK9_RHOSS|nr:hypothetical protein RHSIM_Rhsim08G0178600 [Rhododendron simsii]
MEINNPPLKKAEERGKEVWRRKGVPESSKQGGNTGVANQANVGKDEGKLINVQAVGNGWLNRSAVGKMRRLISAQELELLFKKGKAGKVKAWNGDSAKNERFVWLVCYGKPLNAWNVPTFRAIGSRWGCFIEVDSDTLREVSFDKGRVLISESPNKIGGEVQLIVDERKYTVRVEEEVTFRTVTLTNQAVIHEASSEPEEEDGEVDKTVDDMDASKNKQYNLVDDMEKQKNRISDDRAKNNGKEAEKFENNEEEAEKVENNGLNDSH